MVKTLNIHVTYNNEKKLIICQPGNIINEIASRFQIDMNDFDMYDKSESTKIVPQKITDFMNIEILPKKRNGQRNLHTYIDPESEAKKLVDAIVVKLHQNTPLSGPERKHLIEAFETHSTAIFKKRKIDQTSISSKRSVCHKKVQVNISSNNIKESFSQTDFLSIAEKHVNNEEEAMLRLKRLWDMEKKSTDEIEYLMKETFDDRRNFICLKHPPVIRVRELYPALFCVDQVKKELDRIFYPGKCEAFITNMEKYSKYILHYNIDDDDEIYLLTKKARQKAITSKQKTYAEVVGSVFALVKFLEEDFSFIQLSDNRRPSRSDDVVYPYIDASSHLLKDVFFDEILFSIIVEQLHLCEVSTFSEAILCLMASHFIFNIDYPKNCRRTLTVFEKLYLEANDTADMDDLTVQMIKLMEMKFKEDQA